MVARGRSGSGAALAGGGVRHAGGGGGAGELDLGRWVCVVCGLHEIDVRLGNGDFSEESGIFVFHAHKLSFRAIFFGGPNQTTHDTFSVPTNRRHINYR